MGNPWDRQETESAASYRLFRYYLGQLSPRSVKIVARETGKKEGALSSLRTRNNWVARAEAYDEEIEKRITASSLDKSAELLAENRKALTIMKTRGVDLCAHGKGTAGDGRAMVETAIRLERLLLGEAEARAEVNVSTLEQSDLKCLTDEELDTYRALLAKMAANRGRS